MRKRIFLIAALAAGVSLALAGCGEQQTSQTSELTYWVAMNSEASGVMSNLGESQLAKTLEEKTGVKITYQHPPLGQEKEKFNIMTASDERPDIIEYVWLTYPGGPQKAIDDGTIISISDNKDKAPNLFKYFSENEEEYKLSLTDSNHIFAFPFIRGDKSLLTSTGIVIRQDWLDELGLQMPETIEEWEKVLTEFRDKKGATAPLSVTLNNFGNMFSGAYGTPFGFYKDGDVVKYGPSEPGFREFIAKMNDWYSKKLLDQNFAVLDSKTIDSNILNGVCGATSGSIGKGIGKWMSGKISEGFALEGAPYPTLVKGSKPEIGQCQLPVTGTSFTAVSTSCRDIDAAMKFLDFGYSEEGSMLYNFGIEGESYNMVDGYPQYTDIITNNAEGLSMTAAMSKYMRSYDKGPFIQDKRYMEQYAVLPEQKRAWETWADTNAEAHLLPHTYIKEEEQNEYANLSANIKSYAEEMILKFITGKEPMSKYDDFLQQLQERGLSRVLEIYQDAYDRFLTRSN